MLASLLNSFSAVAIIMMMIVIGWIFGKTGWMKKEQKSLIIKFLINIAVPAACIKNILQDIPKDMLSSAWIYVLLAATSMLVTWGIGTLLAGLLKVDPEKKGGFIVMCAFSNSLFVGLPMCRELFGDEGVPYVMLFYLVNTFMFWTVGCYLIQRSGEYRQAMAAGLDADSLKSGSAKEPFVKRLLSSLKKLATPPLITLFVSIILLLVGFEPPQLVITLCSYLGDTVTPLALLYVGFVLYETGLKSIRIDLKLIIVTVMRFVVAPLLMLALCRIAGIGGTGEGVMVIEAAMPVMTQSVVVSSSVGADEKSVAAGMSFTTLACFVAIPLLMLLIEFMG